MSIENKLTIKKNSQKIVRFLKLLTIFLLLLFSVESCDPGVEEEEKTTPKNVISSDDLILKLSSEIISAPTTQKEKDKNIILNYAMDSLWNVKSTASGLYYEIVEEGEGETLKWADRLEVHYEGFFMNGKKFDSSYNRNRAMQFYIGNMIEGWNEALQLVKPKSKLRLLVPSHLAYGAEGLVTGIGDTLVFPNQVLAFNIEILKKVK